MPGTSLIQAIRDSLRNRRRIRDIRRWSPDDQHRLEFYGQFIRKGDVVFDVGANLGNRTKIFHRMGAVVFAIEPQTPCADVLAKAFSKQPRFHLVRTALGAEAGTASMYVSSASTISSLSPEWIDAVQASGRFGDENWEKQQPVEMQTLDSLIAQFGRPAFAKIDVEGFEDQVLSGLSTPIPAMSFEFTPEYIDSTYRSIDRLTSLGVARFQLSLGESLEYVAAEWCDADGMKQLLAKAPAESFGDVYARFDP